jgi:hypothetical protein
MAEVGTRSPTKTPAKPSAVTSRCAFEQRKGASLNSSIISDDSGDEVSCDDYDAPQVNVIIPVARKAVRTRRTTFGAPSARPTEDMCIPPGSFPQNTIKCSTPSVTIPSGSWNKATRALVVAVGLEHCAESTELTNVISVSTRHAWRYLDGLAGGIFKESPNGDQLATGST